MFELSFLLYGGVFVGLSVLSYYIVKYFLDESEEEAKEEKLPFLACVLGLIFAFLACFLIPFDIYSVNYGSNNNSQDVNDRGDAIKITYYILFCGIIFISFVFAPFTYFYFEELDLDATVLQRSLAAFKYTFATIFIVVVLMVTGLFVKVGSKKNDEDKQWMKDLYENESGIDESLTFAVGVLTIIGYLGLITYCAYGLTALPFYFLRSKKGVDQRELKDIGSAYNIVQERIRAIESKNSYNSSYVMALAERKQLEALRREEKMLANKSNRITQADQTSKSFLTTATRPLKIVIGITLLLFSLLIVTSLTITTVDKGLNSLCGAACGFVLNEPTLPNPLDILLVRASEVFPLDTILLGLVILYLFFSTLYGLILIGIRIVFFQLYSIRHKATVPQGLIMATIVLMFSITAVAMDITTLAPQYGSFGAQTYVDVNGKTQDCSIDIEANDPNSNCHLTQIATFVNRISVRSSFFAIIYYASNCLFLAMFVLGLFYSICCKRRGSHYEDVDDDDEESESLLHSSRRGRGNVNNDNSGGGGVLTNSATARKYTDKSNASSSSSSQIPKEINFDLNSPRPVQSSTSQRPYNPTTTSSKSSSSSKNDIWTLRT